VVGPTRLEYDRLISIVNYIAKLFERVLDPNNPPAQGRAQRTI
jgi:transcriptional regulator of heat shock response